MHNKKRTPLRQDVRFSRLHHYMHEWPFSMSSGSHLPVPIEPAKSGYPYKLEAHPFQTCMIFRPRFFCYNVSIL
jgi:hypothetical protein